MSIIIESVRGMRDVLSQDYREFFRVQHAIQRVLERYGYETIDLPILEHRDLYLRKMGEELVGKIYEFHYGGRHLALRPEWTASVLRCFVTHMQDQPLPVRLSYSGPVFRYQRPQRLTFRQFTQTGVELIGGLAPRADAEIVALACEGLESVGVHGYQIRLGHIGIVRELFMQLQLAERTQGLLIWSLEKMRSQGPKAVQSHFNELMGTLPLNPSLLEGLNDEQVTALLTHTLQAMDVNLSFGTRPPEDIIRRLVRKMRRDDPKPRIEQAVDLLWRLSQIQGSPVDSLPHIVALLNEVGVDSSSLRELQAILTLLEYHGIAQHDIVLDFGLGRGLHYYTGLIFEIYDSNGMQICGGGRYDDLVLVLGGRQSVPAVGFSYGLERVVAACSLHANPAEKVPSILVSAISDADYSYALEVARRLRMRGFIVSVDVRGRSVTVNLRDATKRHISYVAIVGHNECLRREVTWRDLHTRQEQSIKIDDIEHMELNNEMGNVF